MFAKINIQSFIWRLVLPVPLLLVISLGAFWYFVPTAIIDNIVTSTKETATQTAKQFKTVRGYYTRNVIKKVVADGNLSPSFNHANEESGIPLPATLIHDISALLSKEKTSMTLYSEFPFPNRKDRKLDSFQAEAWAFLIKNPEGVYTRQDVVNGRNRMRVATADLMVAQACVDCHNTRADTPKDDWKLGDVRGVLEVNTDITDEIIAGKSLSNWIMLALLAVVVIVIALNLFFAMSISNPLVRIQVLIRRLSKGDTEIEVTDHERKDEVGSIARAVLVFRDNIIEMKHLEQEQATIKQQAEEDKTKAMGDLANRFESEVKGIVDTVSSAATEMRSTAEGMQTTAGSTSSQAIAVTSASENASGNVQTVASAAEELSSSINEISRQVRQSTTIANEAVSMADDANQQITGLLQASTTIGEVIKLISDIAEQTNLLALNATIEAARAGEAGKGFAVVASEVKSLATQTANATEDISQQITGIQNATDTAAESIGKVNGTIEKINEITSSIAAAVEEQGAATQEISRSVQEAAMATSEVTTTINQVTSGVEETGRSAADVLGAASELSQQSEMLNTQVDNFIQEIREA